MNPFRRAVLRAYKGTRLWDLRKLLAEEAKWRRRRTIADNKLAAVRRRINVLAEGTAKELLQGKEVAK